MTVYTKEELYELLKELEEKRKAELEKGIKDSDGRTDKKIDDLRKELQKEISDTDKKTNKRIDDIKKELEKEIKESEDRTDKKTDKKIDDALKKADKEVDRKIDERIKEIQKEVNEKLKDLGEKWVVGEYKWMPSGSKMPEGWVKVDIKEGLTLIQGNKKGTSAGALKKHGHDFADGSAYGVDFNGVLFYVDRPTNVQTVPNEQLLFIKKGTSKQRWITRTTIAGDTDNNLAAGMFAELWQYQGTKKKYS